MATIKDEIEGVRSRKNARLRLTLSMTDVPIRLYEKFCEDVKAEYGDIYWVKLKDLMRKAEAYDAFIKGLRNDKGD